MRRLALAWLLTLGACTTPVFPCTSDAECANDGTVGTCVLPPGYCAFENHDCPSGWAYSEGAPDDLAGRCVEFGDATEGSSSGALATGTSRGTSSGAPQGSSTSSGDDPSASSTSTGASCLEGLPCTPEDACATNGVCTLGVCEPTEFVQCDTPRGACFGSEGSCSDGACVYPPLLADTPCDDGDACTLEDVCDGAGSCAPGPQCPQQGPCTTNACEDGACVLTPVPDGTSCGNDSADRCCGGACVDISTDTAHCGGCNTACAAGLECEPVTETSSCELTPANTSGRCRCQTSNAQCPLGQLCRTVPPFTDRCVTAGDDNCQGDAFFQSSCPSFCGYE